MKILFKNIVWEKEGVSVKSSSHQRRKLTSSKNSYILLNIIAENVENHVNLWYNIVMITVFTDGACNFNKAGSNNKGAYAFVIVNDAGVKITGANTAETNTTNNRMELKAVIAALETIKTLSALKDSDVIINSDSRYIVDCINDKWYVSWIENNWLRKKHPVKNKDLWQKLLSLLTPKITFKWVKGHNNNKWNEVCDEMCRELLYNKSYTVLN